MARVMSECPPRIEEIAGQDCQGNGHGIVRSDPESAARRKPNVEQIERADIYASVNEADEQKASVLFRGVRSFPVYCQGSPLQSWPPLWPERVHN